MKFNWFLGIVFLFAFGGCQDKECLDGDEFPKGSIRELPAFHSVKVKLSATVELVHDTASNVPFVELVSEDNVNTHIGTHVINDTLNLSLGFCFSSHADITLKVHYDTLNTIIVDGPGDVISKKIIVQDNLNLKNRNTGDINITLNVKALNSEILHTGNIFLNGQVETHQIAIYGSGNINTYQAMTDTVYLENNSSGNAWLRVKNRLKANLNGSGDVYFKGFPMLDTLSTNTGKFINDN